MNALLIIIVAGCVAALTFWYLADRLPDTFASVVAIVAGLAAGALTYVLLGWLG